MYLSEKRKLSNNFPRHFRMALEVDARLLLSLLKVIRKCICYAFYCAMRNFN